MIDPDALIALDIPETVAAHSCRDTILYALGLGLGSDPLDPWRLRFVTEEALVAAPTMALVLAWPGNWMIEHPTGIDYSGVVDGERGITFHNPVPVSGITRSRLRVREVIDKGPGKGALVLVERELAAGCGTPIATMTQTVFARADGGFGGENRTLPAPPPLPDRPPDAVIEQATLPQQALLYRLSGDANPLHSSPAAASRAGFDRPILHGLASFGMAAMAVLRAAAEGEPTRLKAISGRFSAPVFPGDRLRTEIWTEGERVLFRTLAGPEGRVALSNGQARLG